MLILAFFSINTEKFRIEKGKFYSVFNDYGSTISNYELYGAMTYLKKDFYDAPSLVIKNSSVSDGYTYIRQKGTSMTVDGVNIPESKIRVEKLYKTKVMKK